VCVCVCVAVGIIRERNACIEVDHKRLMSNNLEGKINEIGVIECFNNV
jgi:hypothetical protein